MNHNQMRGTLLMSAALSASLTALTPVPVIAEPGVIEEVVVTARRREENLQSVPVAVSAFNDATLERQGINDITELQQQLPNTTLQVSRATNSTLTAFIRGIGQQDPLWGFEPGVGIYIDDVYIARPQGAVLDILDVESIEVLRGPQGTLYGKNTIGGALKYQTRKLGNSPDFQVTARAGSFGKQDLVISGSVPLIEDKLYLGGGIATLQRDGFGEFENTGEENYNKDLQSAHIKLQWDISDSLSLALNADKTEDDSNPRGGYRLTPSLVTGQQSYSDIYDSDTSLPNRNEVETQGYSAKLTWDINDDWQFKSISAMREGDTYTSIDFDATAINTFDVPAIYDDEQTTQEFQLNYSGDTFSVVSGLYYFQGDACGAFDVILGLAGITLENGGCVETRSYSAYSQASFDLSDSLSLNVGGRYTSDEKEAAVYRHVFAGTKFPQDIATPIAVQSDFIDDESWSEFSPHIGVQYQVNDDVMTYASFTSGFKSGGFDMRANQAANPNANEPFDPELVNSYEVGIKSTLLDNQLRLNAAVFYNDYQDMQVTVQRAVGTTDFASQVINAGESEMFGVELESTFALTDSLSLTGVLGYIDAEFVQLETFDPNLGQVVDVADEWVISNTPKISANLSLNYSADIGSWQSDWQVSGVYRDETTIFELPSALDEDSYSIINASIVFNSPSGQWMLGLHAKNLTDKEYRVAGYNFPATFDNNGSLVAPGLGGEDTVTGFYGDPRMIMATASYRF